MSSPLVRTCRHKSKRSRCSRTLPRLMRDTSIQIVHQPRHVPHLTFDNAFGPLADCRVRALESHSLKGVADGGQGVAELVGQGGHELVLAALRRAQRLFVLLPLGDVEHRADKADGPALLVEVAPAARRQPAPAPSLKPAVRYSMTNVPPLAGSSARCTARCVRSRSSGWTAARKTS